MLTTHESPEQCQVVIRDMSEHGQSNTVAICRTCPRDRPHTGAAGLFLYNEIKERLTGQGMTVMMVHCLGSCRMPCGVALDAPTKPRVRLSGLKDVDAADLIDAALEYKQTASEDVGVTTFPAALQGHVTAISPKRKRSAA
ncbi:putative metal-binding protein [Caballeronia udeis]|uniref:Metal-binding protein n=1 Tax=Caballeronia udeis TaxID=1232866 RepID=A0ABW8MWL2_9BURK